MSVVALEKSVQVVPCSENNDNEKRQIWIFCPYCTNTEKAWCGGIILVLLGFFILGIAKSDTYTDFEN